MSTSAHTEIVAMVDRVWNEMGGRGGKSDVIAHLQVALPAHLRDYLVEQGIGTKVGSYFRSRGDDGLPIAPEVDEHGTHADIALLDEHEFRYVVHRHVKASEASRRVAQQWADLAFERLGVRIDLANPLGATATA